MGVMEGLRRLYAASEEARAAGWTASWFSFNTPGGRCEACGGSGVQRISLDFLSDVEVVCEDCGGRRYGEEVRRVRVDGLSLDEVLALSVEDAVRFLDRHARLIAPLRQLVAVGLGYLCLGQSVSTLSGGERLRLSLAADLAGASAKKGEQRIYLLDEPTRGLHQKDVSSVLALLRALVEQGHTVVVVEHDPEVWRTADWMVDLGPEGGEGGGRLVAEGTPREVAGCRESWTGKELLRRMQGP